MLVELEEEKVSGNYTVMEERIVQVLGELEILNEKMNE